MPIATGAVPIDIAVYNSAATKYWWSDTHERGRRVPLYYTYGMQLWQARFSAEGISLL